MTFIYRSPSFKGFLMWIVIYTMKNASVIYAGGWPATRIIIFQRAAIITYRTTFALVYSIYIYTFCKLEHAQQLYIPHIFLGNARIDRTHNLHALRSSGSERCTHLSVRFAYLRCTAPAATLGNSRSDPI